ALLAGQTPGGEEGVAVRDPHPFVDDVRVHRLRPRVLTDAFDEVRVEVALAPRCVDGSLGIDADDLHVRRTLLEVPPDAADRPARPDGDDDRVDLAAGLLPQFGAGGAVVRLRV